MDASTQRSNSEKSPGVTPMIINHDPNKTIGIVRTRKGITQITFN